MSALRGLRVLDLSRVLGGPYCTQILADHGADIIKVEPPQGDETRGWGPPFQGETASYYLGVNRNKRGCAIDLTSASGRQKVLALLAQADILVENFKTGTMERWGLGYERLNQQFPRLIHCRVSGFGADGPLGGLPGYDACVQALAGLMSVNGEEGQEPLRVGLPVVDMVTGLNAALAIMFALQERDRSGLGQFLDITLFDCALSLMHPHGANYFLNEQIPARTGNAHPNIAPYETFATRTGTLFLAVGNDRQFARLMDVLNQASLASDARFLSNKSRRENRLLLHQILSALLAEQDAAVLAQQLMQAGVPAAPVHDLAQVLAHPHTQHRDMIWRHGDFQTVASPIKLSRTPARLRLCPPALQALAANDVQWCEPE